MTYITQIKVKRGKKTVCYEQIDPSRPVWAKDNLKLMEITQRIYDGCDCYPWTQMFAWLPVKTIKGKYIWGQKVYKRKFWVVWGDSFHMEPHVEYAELFDILGQN